MRVTVIFDNFGPYHLARLSAAARMMRITGLELRAQSQTYSWPVTEKVPFSRITLPAMGSDKPMKKVLATALAEALSESRPDVVAVNGWGDFFAPQSIRWCVQNKVPFVLMSESSALDRESTALRTWIKKRVVGQASAALVGGRPHGEYVISLGLAPERTYTGYDVVDNAYFAAGRKDMRSERGCGPYFLVSCRFIERKNLMRLIEAYSLYAKSHCDGGPLFSPLGTWPLVLLGDGDLRGTLTAYAHRLGVSVNEAAPWEVAEGGEVDQSRTDGQKDWVLSRPVLFISGFRQYEELPYFYSGAGCFIHPAVTEPWGLVVNEAMASGLPVLVSNRCGCAEDLVSNGENGWQFDPFDVEGLARHMTAVASLTEEERFRMGACSSRIIDGFGPERFATGLLAACEKAKSAPVTQSALIDRLLIEALCTVR